ncbi:unnamed protein product [marine sediment metagenome]|uniref:Uncharacterized protein n=1 Tax=marine sediment metagenome TaxID=412755 RepID=X1GDY4_9ZZZZ
MSGLYQKALAIQKKFKASSLDLSEELKAEAESGISFDDQVENDLVDDEKFVNVSKSAVESFARSLIRSSTELIFAVDESGRITMQTGNLEINDEESNELSELMSAGRAGWQQIRLGGMERVAQAATFEPFGWYFMVTEQRDTFYQAVNQIL